MIELKYSISSFSRNVEKLAASMEALREGAKRIRGVVKGRPDQAIKGILPFIGGSTITKPEKSISQLQSFYGKDLPENLLSGANVIKQKIPEKYHGKILLPKGGAYKSYREASVLDKIPTSEGRKGFNDTIRLHEGFERNIKPNQYAPMNSHLSPQVMLNEHNLVASATGPGSSDLRNGMQNLRSNSENISLKDKMTQYYGDRGSNFIYGQGEKIPKAMKKDFVKKYRAELLNKEKNYQHGLTTKVKPGEISFDKISTKTEPKTKSIGQRFKESIPWIIGMGAGSVGAEILAQKLRKVDPSKYQGIKSVARVALPITGAVLMNTVIPQLQAKLRKTISGEMEKKAISDKLKQKATVERAARLNVANSLSKDAPHMRKIEQKVMGVRGPDPIINYKNKNRVNSTLGHIINRIHQIETNISRDRTQPNVLHNTSDSLVNHISRAKKMKTLKNIGKGALVSGGIGALAYGGKKLHDHLKIKKKIGKSTNTGEVDRFNTLHHVGHK